MPTYILGVSALYHDAAVVLLRDGEIVAAAQEERFTRLKHDASLPIHAAKWAVAQAGIELAQLDWLVFYEKPLRKFERILATSVATFPRSWRSFPRQMRTWLGERLWLKTELRRTFGVAADRILFCEHHLSHAASAFFASPHTDAAVLVADGVGEWATTSLWRGGPRGLTPVAEVRFPHSLGLFYSAITAHLGFAVNEGEYKVMGMAAYGQPSRREALQRLIQLDADGGFSLDLDYFSWHWHPTRSGTDKLDLLLGPARFPGAPFTPLDGDADPETVAKSRAWADLAASAQAVLEDSLLHLVRHAHKTVPSPNLCLAGGVALNAVANHRVAAEGPFAHVWIQPAAGDAGAAMGAALWVWHQVLGEPRGAPLTRCDLGFASDTTREMLEDLGARAEAVSDAPARAAEDLLAGRVIGWVDGAAEWGPRALGHRSILADPRDAAARERVNTRVKFREPFRPFAPSTTDAEAFALPPAARAPAAFMLTCGPVPAELASRIPATVHVNGTARVQVVDPETRFGRLIDAFGAGSGVPVVLNTSFNLKGEPPVNNTVDAMASFVRSGLDVLYADGLRVERPR